MQECRNAGMHKCTSSTCINCTRAFLHSSINAETAEPARRKKCRRISQCALGALRLNVPFFNGLYSPTSPASMAESSAEMLHVMAHRDALSQETRSTGGILSPSCFGIFL